MNSTIWFIVAIFGFAIGVIALIVASIVFFKLRIPSVIGDLSGKTVAREIKAMREFSLAQEERRARVDHTSLAQAPKKKSAELKKKKSSANQNMANAIDGTKVTTVLGGGSTTIVLGDENANIALSELNNQISPKCQDETTVLGGADSSLDKNIIAVKFEITRTMLLVSTNEVIK